MGQKFVAENTVLSEEMLFPSLKWMAEQVPGGFFVYYAREPLELIYVNNECIRLFGCSTLEEFKELTGFTFRGLVHPEDFEKIQNSIDDQIADEGNNNLDYVEYRIIRRDGSVRWFDDYGHFAHLPGYGDVYYVFVSDITEKHNVKMDMERRTRIYESLLDQFDEVADETLTVLQANLGTGLIEEVRGCDLYETDYAGGSIAAFLQTRAESFLVPGDREKFEEIFRLENLQERYYEGKGTAVFVGYCLRASGRQCFVKFTGSAAVDPNSGDVIVVGMETECNTEKVAEVLNKRVLARQYDMVAYIVGDHYGVVIGDPANIKWGSLFPKKREGNYSEYIKEQVLPAASRRVHDPDTLCRELSAQAVVAALEKEDTYNVEVTCEEDGQVFFKRFTYYLVDRETQFYLLLKSDITDVLREERERNEALANALHAAEQANVAKTSFLSNMSHEIRTPMNAIIGLDSIALQDPDVPARTREYLEKIGDSARHLLGLINDILDMSRIESGKIALRQELFAIRGMLDQINTMVQAQCAQKGLTYECRVLGKPEEFYVGDDMKLKQVLINILGNAIKFTDAPGSVVLSVAQTARYGENATLQFVIRDSGIGIDEQFLPRIFDAFSQENDQRNSRYGSTGLGMAITRSIVEMMNGSITVSSKKGIGSEFVVTIPLQCAGVAAPEEARGAAAGGGTASVGDEMYAGSAGAEDGRAEAAGAGVAADGTGEGPAGAGGGAAARAEERNAGAGVAAGRTGERQAAGDGQSDAQNGQKPARAAGKPLAGSHILLAEDMMINAEIMKQLLSMRGIRVTHAENGQQAVELFAESAPGSIDAVLMDVRMPVMDGLEAAAAIRALNRPDAKTVPVIALTANAFDEDVQRSLRAGMDAHLSKPVEPEHLYQTLEELICAGAAG